tara:strand:- start:189 stop:359 length:171 start_codon:yes stop_codon:yes gene_type:complete
MNGILEVLTGLEKEFHRRVSEMGVPFAGIGFSALTKIEYFVFLSKKDLKAICKDIL